MALPNLSLSPFDSLMPPRHTFRLFYFPLSSTDDPTTIASILKSGFERMTKKIPHLAGTVKNLPPTNESPVHGRLAIVPPIWDTDDIFYIRDLRHQDIPHYNVLRERGFPMDVFAFEDVFTVATDRDDWFGLENPVLLVQVNIIEGGIVLAVGMHHSVLDGAAAVSLMGLWAERCKKPDVPMRVKPNLLSRELLERTVQKEEEPGIERFAEYVYRGEDRHEEQAGHAKWKSMTVGFSLYASLKAVPYLFRPILHRLREYSYLLYRSLGLTTYCLSFLRAFAPPKPSDPDTLATSIFFFPSSRLLDLRTTLYPTSASSSQPYISTNDALSALCFAHLTHARWPSLSSEEINLALTLDGRRLLHPPLPDTWMGNAVLHAQIKYPTTKFLPPSVEGMSDLALRLRSRIVEIREGGYAEGLLRALYKVQNLGAVVPSFQAAIGPRGKVCKGMLTAVWTAQHEFYSLDWGFGRCERMRLPKQRFGLYGGASVILPRLGKTDAVAKTEVGKNRGKQEEEGRGAGEGRVGLCLLLPELKGEGIEVLVGLNREAMERLRENEFWNKWGWWICD